jgi:type I restriction enzyme S subunit
MSELEERTTTGAEVLLSLSKRRGVVPRSEFGDPHGRSDSLVGYKVVWPGDIVMNKMQAWNGMFGLSGMHGIVTPEYSVLRPKPGADGRFLTYLLSSALMVSQFSWRSRGMGTAFLRLHPEYLLDTPLPSPPFSEQRAIADFLDTETGRIDALIAKKRALVELATYRHGAWLRAVLEDLRPVLPLKRHWQVIDCKHRTPRYVGEGYPVVSPGDTAPGRLDLSRAHRFVDRADFLDLTAGNRLPQRGDIVYSRNASIGIASYVDTNEPFTMGQDVCLITSRDQDQLYLSYVLNTIGSDQLDVEKLGTTFSRINISQILELQIPVPPPETQRRLADEFDRAANRIDSLVHALNRQIELLAEHRQALITVSVTAEQAVHPEPARARP